MRAPPSFSEHWRTRELHLACRLRDELRASQREADKQAQEICTLRSALASKEQALKAAASAAQTLTERVLNAEGKQLHYCLQLTALLSRLSSSAGAARNSSATWASFMQEASVDDMDPCH